MSTNIKGKLQKKAMSTGVLFQFMLSFIFILLGGGMILAGQLPMVNFYYAIGAAICVIGIMTVIFYFKRKDYLDMDKYGFSTGMFMIIAGGGIVAYAQVFADKYVEFFGVLLLVNSIILLQYAIQVYMMDGRAAGIAMAFTIFEAVIAILSVINPFDFINRFPFVYNCFLVISGFLGIISMILVKFRRYNLNKEETRDKNRILEDEPIPNETASDNAATTPFFESNHTEDDNAGALSGRTYRQIEQRSIESGGDMEADVVDVNAYVINPSEEDEGR